MKQFQTTHALAQYLLSKPDTPVRHYQWHHECFGDHVVECVSAVEVVDKNGNTYIRKGKSLEEKFYE